MPDYAYPVTIIEENGAYRAVFPDFDSTETFGETREEVLEMAADLLETMVSSLVADGVPLPLPSDRGDATVNLSAISAAKLKLRDAIKDSGLTQKKLADQLGWKPPQVHRLLDLRHHSRMDQLEQAFAAVGKRLVITIQDAA